MNQLSLGFRNQSFNRIAKLSSGLAIKSVNLVICHDYFLPRSGHSDELREIDWYNFQEQSTERNNICASNKSLLRSNYNSLLLVSASSRTKVCCANDISPPLPPSFPGTQAEEKQHNIGDSISAKNVRDHDVELATKREKGRFAILDSSVIIKLSIFDLFS